MNKIKISAVQMCCGKDRKENISHAAELVSRAAESGADIVLLPELFANIYFCQEKNYDLYALAKPLAESDEVKTMCAAAGKYSLVIPVSFYERDGNTLYNSAAIVDTDGSVCGVYRKTHIPDDQYYQEKFYFTPGNTGFRVWKTKYGNLGVGICWDQWFPEAARIFALNGADYLFYPTAIGSEPILGCDSSMHWQRCMQGHAASNIIPVIAANRYGTETVSPCTENNMQSSSLTFYGTSFITDETGAVITSAPRGGDCIISAEFDPEEIRRKRLEWGVFRDRRPECYTDITK